MPGEQVYHYTGLEGLTGVLGSKHLWATDIRYLNDTTEATFGKQRLDQLLAEDNTHGFPVPEALKVFRRIWRNFRLTRRPFVACFCSAPDLLSQWRGYGKLGYSIGFEKEALRAHGNSPVSFVLRDMVYKKDEQLALVTPIVDALLAAAPDFVRAPQGSLKSHRRNPSLGQWLLPMTYFSSSLDSSMKLLVKRGK